MKIQVKVTNNAGGRSPVIHEHTSLAAAHEQAARINDWPKNQILGSSAVVLVDGDEQDRELDVV